MVSGGCVVYCLNVTSRIKDKLTGYCIMRSKDGKFKPRRRRMQNVLLYRAKWSHLNKDKRDCRTFQLIKQFAHSWRHLKRGLLIYNLIL